MQIAVRVNGSDVRLEQGSVAELVAEKGLAAASLVVEYNGRIIKQAEWNRVQLKQGDVLELLNFVGGG